MLKTFMTNLLSRKLWFSIFSVLCILYTISLKISDTPLSVAIGGITVICVTLVTGLAKIDISANIGKQP